MAFTKAPSTWFGAGYSLASSNIKLTTVTAGSNIALPQLTDTDANATTGDIRVVAFAIVEALYQAWVAQAGNQPTKMGISRSASNKTTGKITYKYDFQFEVSPPSGAYAVSSE